jgi:uncharacterized protein (TIGR03086 family)
VCIVGAATVEQLTGISASVGALIAGIKADQWDDPTPCPEWNVRALVQHLSLGNIMDTSALLTRPPTRRELLAGFDETAAALVEAFRPANAVDRILEVPFGRVSGLMALHLRLTEMIVHGWDLARATGQQVHFPDEVVEQELGFTAEALVGRPAFAPAVAARGAAGALDRLVARLGRVA